MIRNANTTPPLISMRSRSFLNKCHSFIRTPVHHFRPPLKARGLCSARHARLRPLVLSRTIVRSQSTSSTPSLEPDTNSTTQTTGSPVEGIESPTKSGVPPDDAEKIPPKIRRIRTAAPSANSKESSTSPRDTNPLEFPEGLNKEIIFVPTESLMEDSLSSLPPPEIYEEALHKLLITLHPQNQARAISPPSGSSRRPIEPTLGLYCPIEGGDYIIDSTVHELAFKTGCEVLVLDGVQLAAGEWGKFGKGTRNNKLTTNVQLNSPTAANALNLVPNPLRFSSVNRTKSREYGRKSIAEGDQEGERSIILTAPPRMSVTLPRALSTLPGRMAAPSSSRKPSAPSRLDLFFETLVNMPSPELLGASALPQSRPRLLYIRDFPTLAPSSSMWYPSLLNAVRQRRRGLLARTSIASSPVTIIFGMSPSIANPLNDNTSGPRSLSLFISRSLVPPYVPQGSKIDFTDDFSESDNAQAAREKRLRARLKKWVKMPSMQGEFPKLHTRIEGREAPLPGVILIDGPNGSSSMDGTAINFHATQLEEEFFRSVTLVPRSRSLHDERHSRMSRRREINELTMRMGVGTIGGVIETSPAFPEGQDDSPTLQSSMWEVWSNRLESWSTVRKISDRAVGNVIDRLHQLKLFPTPIPWIAVQLAWMECNRLGNTRARWLEEVFGDKLDQDDDGEAAPGSASDKIVENLKMDPDLDLHEARLLPCIVDGSESFPSDILTEN